MQFYILSTLRNIKRIIILATTLIPLSGIAVSRATDETDVEIKIGCAKIVDDKALMVKFVEVIQDSRCAKGAVCVWAGIARIMIEVSGQNRKTSQHELETSGSKQSIQFDGIQITLKALDPYPDLKISVKQSDYKATFSVRK